MTAPFLLQALAALAAAPQATQAPRPEAVLDATDDRQAFLEVVAARDLYFVHEPILVRIRAGFDRDFLENAMVELFRRPLDVPAQIQAPWWTQLAGAIVLEDAPGTSDDGARASIAVNDSSVRARRSHELREGGREFTVFEVRRRLLPEREGEFRLPEALLRFAYGTRFEDDLLSGRVALDRRDARVRSAPLTLRIEPLPEADRPPEFTGAVGRFSVRAATDTSELELGQSLKLELTLAGDGDLRSCEAPRLERVAGFEKYRVWGVTDERMAPGECRFVYDLAPLDAMVTKIPSIPFVFFDGTPPAGYRSVHTEPIPLRVRDARPGPPAARPPGIPAPSPEEQGPPPRTGAALAGFAVLLAAALALWWRARGRHGEPARIRAAATRARAALAAPGADLAAVLTDFLSAALDCPTAAVQTPDLARRLEARGAPRELAQDTARLLEALVDARYGGAPPEAAEARLLALVDGLRSSLR